MVAAETLLLQSMSTRYSMQFGCQKTERIFSMWTKFLKFLYTWQTKTSLNSNKINLLQLGNGEKLVLF